MTNYSAERMTYLNPYYFAGLNQRLAEMKAEGRPLIRLDIGSPDQPPAEHIIQALIESASQPGHHGYQSHRGTEELRLAWMQLYRRLYDIELDSQRELVPLLGSKEGIFHLSMALINPGDVVLVPDPGYITYTRSALFAGAQIYKLPLLAANDYLPDLEAIPPQILKRAKLLWMNYPNNPTAALAAPQFFAQAVEFAHQHKLIVCHDAAYAQITFNGKPAPSILSIPGALDVAMEFNSLSKTYNMAGWRVAAVLGNREALETLFSLKTNLDSGCFRPVMDAAVAALTGEQDWLIGRNQIYRQRRDLITASLQAMSLNAIVPQATIYVWSPIPEGWSSMDFTNQLLEHTGVSLTPGVIFGRYGEGYIRIALTASQKRAQEAMHLMRDWMESWA